jgi:PPK2 family polyphosphate:nucleotide phosphotransferase
MAKKQAKHLKDLIKPLRVAPGSKVDLNKDYDPGFKDGLANKKEGEAQLTLNTELLGEYQARLAAQDIYGLLVVIQGIDASGKDSMVRHVMSGINPQGVVVHSFKVPSDEELDHDYLWRYALRVPARGQIAVFNRSHYEEVLVVRVHPDLLAREKLPPAAQHDVWHRRFREINAWERYLVDNGIHVVKLFLNVSREEQRLRFLDRIDQPEKNWKFSMADVKERARWDDYQHAFSEMLTHTSTESAPWYVIPADHKWYAHIAASSVIVDALAEIDPQYPAPTSDPGELEAARAELEAQAPRD